MACNLIIETLVAQIMKKVMKMQHPKPGLNVMTKYSWNRPWPMDIIQM